MSKLSISVEQKSWFKEDVKEKEWFIPTEKGPHAETTILFFVGQYPLRPGFHFGKKASFGIFLIILISLICCFLSNFALFPQAIYLHPKMAESYFFPPQFHV